MDSLLAALFSYENICPLISLFFALPDSAVLNLQLFQFLTNSSLGSLFDTCLSLQHSSFTYDSLCLSPKENKRKHDFLVGADNLLWVQWNSLDI